MKQLKAFNQFINEDLAKDDKARLRELGLTNYSAPFEERYQELMEEWMDDPAVRTAIDTLKAKFDELFAHQIDAESPADANSIDKIKKDIFYLGIDDIGWFEYVFLIQAYV